MNPNFGLVLSGFVILLYPLVGIGRIWYYSKVQVELLRTQVATLNQIRALDEELVREMRSQKNRQPDH